MAKSKSPNLKNIVLEFYLTFCNENERLSRTIHRYG